MPNSKQDLIEAGGFQSIEMPDLVAVVEDRLTHAQIRNQQEHAAVGTKDGAEGIGRE